MILKTKKILRLQIVMILQKKLHEKTEEDEIEEAISEVNEDLN